MPLGVLRNSLSMAAVAEAGASTRAITKCATFSICTTCPAVPEYPAAKNEKPNAMSPLK